MDVKVFNAKMDDQDWNSVRTVVRSKRLCNQWERHGTSIREQET